MRFDTPVQEVNVTIASPTLCRWKLFMKVHMFEIVYLYKTYKTVVTGYDFIKYVECETLGDVHMHKKYPPPLKKRYMFSNRRKIQ